MDIDSFAEVVRTGTVCGVDAEVGPEVVRRVLGDSFAENVDGPGFCYSYDLAEFFWYRRPRGLGWQAGHFSVQTHRLDRPLRFADLRAAVEPPLVPVDRPHDGYRLFWQAESEVVVLVELDSDAVHQISSAFRRDRELRYRYDGQRSRAWQRLAHVVGLPDRERLAWIERHRPEEDPDGWWRFHCLMVLARALTFDRFPERARWVDFAVWAWKRGVELDHVPPAAAAIQLADFFASVENRFPEVDRPAADWLVGDCLALVAGTRTRTDKNLLDVAALHRHGVRDPELLAALDRWLALRRAVAGR